MTMRLTALIGALLLAGCAATPSHTDTAAPSTPDAAIAAPAPVAQTPPPSQAAQMAAAKRASRTAGSGLDPDDEAARTDLWLRVRRGFAIPDLDTDLVRKGEQWYTSRPDYVARMTERSSRYMFYIVEEIERRGMPTELALLPFIESAFNPQAISGAKASGMWQFMAATGKDFDLKQNVFRDDRRNVIASTRAALDYLTKLHGQFGDWQLALAAYNWGEGSVQRAIDRNQRAGKPTDYLSLKMPEETRYYVPKLQAVKNIRDPEKYGLELADVPDAPYFAIVRPRDDVKRAAELAVMSQDAFQYLNPHHNRPVIAGADEHAILLPIDKAELFAAKLELADQPLVSWQAYRMHRGETLPQVAAKFALPVESLRAVNGIGPKARLHEGHTLLVPSQRPTAQSEAALGQAVFTTVPQGRTFYHRVQRGESLAAIATRYGVTTQDIRGWNGMVHASVRVGQQLRITSDFGPNAARAKRASGKPVLTTRVKSAPRAKAAPKNGKATASRRAKTTGR
jgi:membrane-bound lytic murein transglycosylase D